MQLSWHTRSCVKRCRCSRLDRKPAPADHRAVCATSGSSRSGADADVGGAGGDVRVSGGDAGHHRHLVGSLDRKPVPAAHRSIRAAVGSNFGSAGGGVGGAGDDVRVSGSDVDHHRHRVSSLDRKPVPAAHRTIRA